MLQLLNKARTESRRGRPEISSQNITPDIQATLKYYGVNLQCDAQSIASSPPQPPLAWSPAARAGGPGAQPGHGDQQFQSHTGSDGSSPDAADAGRRL